MLYETYVLARQMDVTKLDDMKLKWLPKENEVKLDICRNTTDLGSKKFNNRGKVNFIEVWINYLSLVYIEYQHWRMKIFVNFWWPHGLVYHLWLLRQPGHQVTAVRAWQAVSILIAAAGELSWIYIFLKTIWAYIQKQAGRHFSYDIHAAPTPPLLPPLFTDLFKRFS